MRVQFKIDGGFVYLPARSEPVTVDTDELPEAEAAELERLVDAAGFSELPETSPHTRGAPDGFRYTISVTRRGHTHTVQLTDPIEDPDLQALVKYLEAKAG
jgi:hypothetical protein